MALKVGDVVEGKVARILKYGAIVELENGESGLVHISEIAPEFVVAVEEHLREGDVVKVMVIGVKEEGRYDLSIRRAEYPDQPRRRPMRQRTDAAFEKRLSEFMRRSNKRLSELSRGRSGRRRRR